MGVRSYTGIRKCLRHTVLGLRIGYFREVLDVHLVHDARSRGNHFEVVKRILAPPQELVALCVSLVLDIHVSLERVRPAEQIRDH